MGTEQLRENLRRHYKAKRDQIPPQQGLDLSCRVAERLTNWDIFLASPIVFSFVSHRGEPCLDDLPRQFPQKTWALPRCEGNLIAFHTWTPALLPNAWGILEPPPHSPLVIPPPRTLCLVPGIVFDRRGYRLGFGKGYYDRFFATYPHCLKVGILFAEFLIEETYPQPWDVGMDYLVHDRSIDPIQN
jgi:5-formyltetrahydrofolate cyclo-ligase